ncbi:MFS transporter [Chelatococcus reniformis]|uniref:MFS transporter n=1 Tax=Chelatococcus reniformis TaxID=1494448 RepID=A0A916UKE0_9HYPH|nr:MFS transporter [Chelatococcus reniformis]GGC74150.1 MFS transporter [Chelatococcus reniformis]
MNAPFAASPGAREAPGEFRHGWPVVAACFVLAVFSWGFGFYGQAVYLAELQRINNWSTSLVATATTAYYLFGAGWLAIVPKLFRQFDIRLVLGGGAAALGAGAIAMSAATQPWQLFAASVVLGFGWACTSSTAIATTLARWFDRKRGLAISLALNGASFSGLSVAPALVFLSARVGLEAAVAVLAAALFVVLVPLLLAALRPPAMPLAASGSGDDRGRAGAAPAGPGMTSAQALRSLHFWSLAVPFALGLAAQAGYLMHQVAILLPTLEAAGTSLALILGSAAAICGRLGLGLVIDRLDQRLVTAMSLVSQAAALAAIALWPQTPLVLYGGVILFGLSVGNLITLPALIVQREFAPAAFGLIVGLSTAIGQLVYAFAPALLGYVHDLFGGYGTALALCIALELAGAAGILWRGGTRGERTAR